MHWADFHFIRPWWLLALVPAVLLVVLLCKRRAAGTGWDGLITSSIMQRLMVGRDERLARAPIVLLGFAWLLAVLALAGPTWERQPQAMYRASLDQVVVLDLSPSMTGTDIAPSRLARARFAISDLLAQTREGRTALVVFGAEHHVVTPLTDDAATIEQLLRALSVDVLPVQGDRAASALRAALQLLTAATSRAAHVILLSDGVGDPAESIAAAIELRAAGAKLSVIGIGTERESQLRELARSGGGAYWQLGQLGPLGGEGRRSPALELEAVAGFTQTPGRELTADLWAEKGAWLLLPLLVVAALGYRRGWLVVLVVVLFQPPQDAMAFDWNDLWLTPNQQAKRLLESGQAQQAAELFADPRWQATARYRSGEFDKAAEQFAASNAAYNRANALARAGKLQAAIDSYDEALAAQPNDEDARFNRDLLQELLEQQQQQGQQKQQSGDQQQEQEQEQEQGQEQGKEQSPQPQNDQQPSKQDGGQQAEGQQDESQQQANRPRDSQHESSAQDDEQQDAQQQAKDDVAPQTADASVAEQVPEQTPAQEQPAQQQQPPQGDSLARATTEKELALEQWLRQVPDDPGGLLRRKFMLEHLQRRKEPGTP